MRFSKKFIWQRASTWAGFWNWSRIPCPPCSFLSASGVIGNNNLSTFCRLRFRPKTLEMNESGWNFWNYIFYRIKKFDLKKKLLKTKLQHFPKIMIFCSVFHCRINGNATSDWVFLLIPTCNADHNMLQYYVFNIFFWDRIFWFG